MKTCNACHQEKPLTEFYSKTAQCVPCKKAKDTGRRRYREDRTATPQPTQPQAGAVPLTDYKAYALIDSMGWSLDDQEKDDMLRLLRATEAAHGIKGGQHGTS